jgi:NAD(P)-dependent dehydrogenase (short-subunit alcohol dehydrogenase family)
MVRYGQVTGVVGDLSSLAAVRRLAKDVAAQHPRLDVLVNNAGTGSLRRETTADGFERQFAVNHLAPFLLTNLLLERLKASSAARVVTVSSMAHRSGKLDFDDLNWERRKYSGLQAYSASKLANILFTIELARRLSGSRVTANCLHPGVVATNIFSTMGFGGRLLTVLFRPFMLSPAKGALTSVYLASSPEVANVTGKFFDKCREAATAPAAQDADAARRLWEISERLAGLE